MTYFRYKVVRDDGRPEGGVLRLPSGDEAQAQRHLEAWGGRVASVRRLPDWLGLLLSLLGLAGGRIPRRELAAFLSSLAVMMQSGLPLLTALNHAGTGVRRPAMVRLGAGLGRRLRAGSGFARAAREEGAFPPAVLFLFGVGEESGTLDRALGDAADHLKRLDRIRGDLIRALAYPSLVLGLMGSAFIFWFWFVVPRIEDLFLMMNADLPLLSHLLIVFSHGVIAYGGLGLFILVLGALLGTWAYHRAPGFRRGIQSLVLRLPVAGGLVQAAHLALFTEYLSLLAQSGVSLQKSLLVLSEAMAPGLFRERAARIREGMLRGGDLADEVERAGMAQGHWVQMVRAGEKSGRLPEQLDLVARENHRLFQERAADLGRVLEPVILLLGGGVLALILAGLLLPLYDLASMSSVGG